MDSTLRSVIHDMVIGGTRPGRAEAWRSGARAILTEDLRRALEGDYGVHADGRVEGLERLPQLAHDPEAAETARRIRRHLEGRAAAGIAPAEAVEALVREAAFTHLNRLVAFKMLEARGLTRGVLRGFPRPNAFMFHLANHPEDEALVAAGRESDAFRHFLLAQAAQVAAEVRVLFDPDSLASRLFPRPAALREVIELLNHPDLAPAWAEDETVGWVYQYFNEKEKADVFDRLYKKKQKIRREDVPAATQLFTPRWIVEFLVQNTLGRLWLQMHPDSRLAAQMPYLAPLAGEIPPEPLKPAREITVLDPACGTMHFGLVAFDLLAAMYREELANAGQPGWPATPSVPGEAEIPATILAENLYGIDIDLRAVQLAALTLYLKAKGMQREARLTRSNLVVAGLLPFRQADLEAFIAEMQFSNPIYERLLRALWPRLREVSELGSLARLERDLADVVEHERARRRKEERENPLLVDVMGETGPAIAAEDQWRAIEDHLVWSLDHYAKAKAEAGHDVTFFTGEATRGLRLLDVMRRRYDVVLSNPPYLTNFTDSLKALLARDYRIAKSDTYAAFIMRCVEWLRPGGRVGMITQQSFMFNSDYEKLRSWLLDTVSVEGVAHTGPGAFEEIGGQKVNTTIFAFRSDPSEFRRARTVSWYVQADRSADKERSIRRALDVGERSYFVPQQKLKSIPGNPWTYWISDELRERFAVLPPLAEAARPRQGLATADNTRFLRFWWEVGRSRTTFGCPDLEQAERSGGTWFPHVKGGELRKWYGNQEYVVNWACDGSQIKEHIVRQYPYLNGNWGWVAKNTEWYFRPGVTWTLMSSKGFSARFMNQGFITGHKGSAAYAPTHPESMTVLGILNSSIALELLRAMSPAMAFEVGHVSQLPVPTIHSGPIAAKAESAVRLARIDSTADESTYDFTAPLPWETGIAEAARRAARLAEIEREIDDEVYRLYGISDEDRAAIEAELRGPRLAEDGAASEDAPGEEAEAEAEPAGGLTRQELATRWVSYAVGIVMGRFRPGVEGELGSGIVEDWETGERRPMFTPQQAEALRGLADADGIVPLDADHPEDLAGRVERALELALGARRAEEVLREVAGGDLRRYLWRDFFTKVHLRWYRKRPVYWLLQSPKKHYSVYLFHERITRDTLFLLRGRYVEPRLTLLQHRLDELRARRDAAEGSARKRLGNEHDALLAQQADVAEFAKRLREITETSPGYDPHIDDGVLINMAPLWPLLPSWQAEPKKCWEALVRGDYDWSHMAMRHWPDRVLAKCRSDKSLAIAHGVDTESGA